MKWDDPKLGIDCGTISPGGPVAQLRLIAERE